MLKREVKQQKFIEFQSNPSMISQFLTSIILKNQSSSSVFSFSNDKMKLFKKNEVIQKLIPLRNGLNSSHTTIVMSDKTIRWISIDSLFIVAENL